MRIAGLLGCIAATFFVPQVARAGDDARAFRAGAYAMDVTPKKFPVSVNGGMQDRQAKGAHDPLHARCLVLDDGKTRIALVVVDSCMIPRAITDAAKAKARKLTGIPPERILISATHTHSAPTLAGVFQSEPDEDYPAYLTEKIAQGIERAAKNLAPARIGWGVAQDKTQVFNRRWLMKTLQADPFGGLNDKVKMNPGYLHKDLAKPAGPIDPDVSLLSVQSADGRPLALLANYSLHYVGGLPALSADYFGAFAERVRELVAADKADPPFVGILSNGTSGDINNINYGGSAPGKRGEGEQIRLVADSVARAAHEAYKKINHQSRITLAMAQTEIELGVRLPTPADVAKAREILDKAKEKKVLTTLPEVYARETTLIADYPPKVKIVLQAIRVGEVGIVAIPCETFVEIGLDLKKRSPLRPTFTIELANGYNGYLPTPAQHKLGGYETWRARSSYLEVDASTHITRALLELLGQVAR
jgi:neutral ceramidase